MSERTSPGVRLADLIGGRWLRARLAAAGVMAILFVITWQAPPGWLMAAPTATVTPPAAIVTPGKTVIVAPPAANAASSALTAKGLGEFANLEITVSQTTQLVNQAITVSWKGGVPTPGAPDYPADFLQIMQCWGDDTANGPDRTQCAFGVRTAGGGFGTEVATRLLTGAYKDPLETGLTGTTVYVPFVSALGDQTDGPAVSNANPYYNQYDTNEIVAARTYADGTGSVVFETKTDAENPGLGCGAVLSTGANSGKPRSCWLVIVPRGETEVDGTKPNRLNSSPLTTTNWASRIAFPLSFRPVGNPCPLGANERPTAGTPLAAEAVYNWQPALCAGNGPVFNYTSNPTAVINTVVTGDNPGLGLVNEPVPAGVANADQLTYAPILLSGLTIVAAFDRQPPADATEAQKAETARPIPTVKLTPRVLAKLLTASYGSGPATGAPYVLNAPLSVTRDPDFLYDNPAFAGESKEFEILVPFGNDSIYKLVWKWIMADKDAADFIAGFPDNVSDVDKNTRRNTGMRVNPYYQGLDLPQTSFPKIDQYTFLSATAKKYNDVVTNVTKAQALTQQDFHAYTQSLAEGAANTLRGDPMSRIVFDPITGQYSKLAPGGFGRRSVMALSDTTDAARYAVAPALLRNAAGNFVGPENASLLAAQAEMYNGGAGVLVPNVSPKAANAYPLTVLTYAVTRPRALSTADAAAYATFIRYAVGDGQVSGDSAGKLPRGYVPLPDSLRTAAKAAATSVQNRVGLTASPTTSAKATVAKTTKATSTKTTKAAAGNNGGGGGGGNGGGGNANSGGNNNGGDTAGNGGTQPTTSPTQATGFATTAGAGPSPSAVTRLTIGQTPTESAGAGRFAVMVALLLGIAGAIAGPAVPKLARHPA